MRKATPRGQMTRGNNSGPAVMMMPPEIRSTFMPNPPLKPMAPVSYKRRNAWTGVAQYMAQLQVPKNNKNTPKREVKIPKRNELKQAAKLKACQEVLQPLIAHYRVAQVESNGTFQKTMNCFNTLFIGRLAYEVTDRKLLREMEQFGPVKDLRLVYDKKNNTTPRGYAFCEFQREDDMKAAYRQYDGTKLEGRMVVVDVERGHTVPDWLPRRLGGGLGGTRLGRRNDTRPGRVDPVLRSSDGAARSLLNGPPPPLPHYNDRGRPPPPAAYYYDRPPPHHPPRGPPPGYGGYHDRGPPPGYDRRYDSRKRYRSRSPPGNDRYRRR